MAEDLHRQVARLHRDCIERGFLATLGEGFLAQLYAAIDADPRSVLLVERDPHGQVQGFVAGTCAMGRIYRRMLRRPFALAGALLPALLRRGTLRRVLDLLRYRGTASGDGPALPRAELLSLAVRPAARGSGVADRLYARLAEHFATAGEPGFRIVVGEALLPAHRFYRRAGAQPVGPIQVHPGEPSTLYVQALPRAGTGAA